MSANPTTLAPDGLPIPPGDLMRLSVASADPDKFLTRGSQSYRKLVDSLARTGFDLEKGQVKDRKGQTHPITHILEWGCGCGRVARNFANSKVKFYGIDINEDAIAWCKDNLPFGKFSVCDLVPPVDLPTGQFDLIYAGSVLTHLSLPSQLLWMQELFRLLKPNGRLLLTFHGAFYIVRHHTRPDFNFWHVDAGLFAEVGSPEGSNQYGAYQTLEATKSIFFPFKEELHIQMHDILGGQDTVIFSKDREQISHSAIGMSRAAIIISSSTNTAAITVGLKSASGVVATAASEGLLEKQTKILHLENLRTPGELEAVLLSGQCDVECIYSR